jgi:hypothetical protein
MCARPFAVFAHYVESGHRYEIQRAHTFDVALAIAERATAQLTDVERKLFNYIVEAVTAETELERVKSQRDIYAAAIRSALDCIKREGEFGLDAAVARLHEAMTTVQQIEKRA